MKPLYTILLAALCTATAPAWAQTRVERAPDPVTKQPPDTGPGKIPDPGLSNLPDASGGTQSDSSGASGDAPTSTGIVKVPPSTGTERVVKPPKSVDPGITAPTDDIDRKNRQKSEEKKELMK
jgi:hypothetical protein